MNVQARLEQMKSYREEAMKKPLANRLYIEDLNLSIAMFEETAKRQYAQGDKWVDSEELVKVS